MQEHSGEEQACANGEPPWPDLAPYEALATMDDREKKARLT